MQNEKRHSYGVIPFYKNERGEYEALLILQSRLGPKVWGFPKGTPEKGESPVETARREVCEEIGCTELDIQEEVSATESYVFTELDGSVIEKRVTYFPAFLKSKKVIPQETEVDDYVWCFVEDAKEKITYPETENMFNEVCESLDFLTKNG